MLKSLGFNPSIYYSGPDCCFGCCVSICVFKYSCLRNFLKQIPHSNWAGLLHSYRKCRITTFLLAYGPFPHFRQLNFCTPPVDSYMHMYCDKSSSLYINFLRIVLKVTGSIVTKTKNIFYKNSTNGEPNFSLQQTIKLKLVIEKIMIYFFLYSFYIYPTSFVYCMIQTVVVKLKVNEKRRKIGKSNYLSYYIYFKVKWIGYDCKFIR